MILAMTEGKHLFRTAEASGLVPGRSCDGCMLCCRLPDIDELDKPANAACRHCLQSGGCAIYDQRPALCRDFHCLWRTAAGLDDRWHPNRSGMMIYRQGPQLTVLVDPDREAEWEDGPYRRQLEAWAADAEESGGYVIVFTGDRVEKLEPPRSPV